MPTPPKHRTVEEILGSRTDDFKRLWASTPAAPDDFEPIPPGTYRCLVVDGKLSTAKSGTPSYKVVFLITDGDYRERRLFHDCWLTPDALPHSKRDLMRLGIASPAEMQSPPRTGIVVEVKVALRCEDDGRQFNRVSGFQVVGTLAPPDILNSDTDDEDEEAKRPSRGRGNALKGTTGDDDPANVPPALSETPRPATARDRITALKRRQRAEDRE